MFDWKGIPGAGMSVDEKEWLRYIGTRMSEKFDVPLIVNIGIYRGSSMHCLRAGAPDAVLFGVDISDRRVIALHVLNAIIVIADSTTYHTVFNHPIHFLFVDGSHEFGDVSRDIAGWCPKVVPGGMVAFHDYTRGQRELLQGKRSVLRWGGITQAVDQWWDLPKTKMAWEEIPAAGSIRAFRRLNV
jgi:hypothetical protein